MTDIVIYRDNRPWAEPKLAAFGQGLTAHGLEFEERQTGNWRASDLAVVWGHRDTALHDIQRQHGGRYLVLERGYIGDIHERRRWCSIGYDGLNGRADFCNEYSPPDRWNKYFDHLIQPWRFRDDGYVLLVGQIPGDASLQGNNHVRWLMACRDKLIDRGERVVFRPHPQAMERAQGSLLRAYGFDITASHKTLAQDLDGAKVVLTWNSNVGVDAALSGVPVIACDKGSMVYDVAAHEPDAEPVTPFRAQWGYDLGYTMWLESEIASGEAWEHLR